MMIPQAASLALHALIGAALGVVYFGSVWRDARRIVGTASLAHLLASMAARFVLLGCVLTLASLEGAAPLLAAAAGVLLGRTAVLRHVRATWRS